MNEETTKSEEYSTMILLLTDEQGSVFAIPRDVVESYRLTVEQKSDLEKSLGDDVSGYTMYESYVNEQLEAMRRTELLQKAEESRQLRDAFQDETEVKAAEGVRPGLRLVGKFINALGLSGLRLGK